MTCRVCGDIGYVGGQEGGTWCTCDARPFEASASRLAPPVDLAKFRSTHRPEPTRNRVAPAPVIPINAPTLAQRVEALARLARARNPKQDSHS